LQVTRPEVKGVGDWKKCGWGGEGGTNLTSVFKRGKAFLSTMKLFAEDKKSTKPKEKTFHG